MCKGSTIIKTDTTNDFDHEILIDVKSIIRIDPYSQPYFSNFFYQTFRMKCTRFVMKYTVVIIW